MMKRMTSRRVVYLLTLVNIAFQLFFSVYMVIRNLEVPEILLTLPLLLFPVEYILLSGPISLICLIVLATLIIRSRKEIRRMDICAVLFQVEYIIFYGWLLSIQTH